MKQYHSFGKNAIPALLVTMLIGTILGCTLDSPEDDPILQSIAITSLPAKTVYALGDSLDLNGLVVTGTYADGTTKVETVSLSNISGYDANTAGQQTLTVTLNGKTATFTVTVNTGSAPAIELDELTNAPGGMTAADPVLVLVKDSLANGGWEHVLSVIAQAGKYVSLDLSACAMTGTEFDPGTGSGAARITALILPSTVKSIKTGTGDGATFQAFTTIRSISGAGVETVGDYAFRDCESLTMVSLPIATTIGDFAFQNCTNLTTVPPAAATIGNYAFGNTTLTTLSLPAATAIGTSAFSDCTNLTTVDLPEATTIGVLAFNYCGSLMTVDLPKATTIGNSAFAHCGSLTTVDLPKAAAVGSFAFSDCAKLTAADLPEATAIGGGAFHSCTSLTTVSLPAAPPSINAESQSTGLFVDTGSSGTISIRVPAGAVSAYTSAWTVSAETSAGSDSIIYGKNHKAVRIDSQEDDPFLQSIEITSPPTKTAYAPGEALDLSGLVVTGTYSDGTTKTETVSLSSISGYNANTAGQQTLTVTLNGKTATFTVTVNNTSTPLDGLDGLASASNGNTAANPVSLTLNGSFTNDSWAVALSAIAAADKYVSIDLSACTMTGTEFDPGTGTGAAKVTALILPAAAESINASIYKSSFNAFTALASISGAGVKTVGNYAFYNCARLTTVSLPVAAIIGNYAFWRCTNLTTLSLPAATTIGDRAFYNCRSLTTVSLPAAATIGNYAFYDCSLTTVSLPVAATIGDYAFWVCTSLTEVSLPMAETIGDQAFSECTSLTTVSLPAAKTIDKEAFYHCTNLAMVSLPAAPPSINYIFSHTYSGMTTITVRVPTGAVSAYTSAWGVNVNTPMADNVSQYGLLHKDVLITDTAQ